jgi:hypothetical protein
VKSVARRVVTQRVAPFNLLQIIANGQSLSVGSGQSSASTSQPYSNKMLFDSSNTYPTSGGFLGTLSLVPLTSPQRALGGATPYPLNILGETADIAMANQLTAYALAEHFTGFNVVTSCTGIGGAPMSSINKGGAFNAYQAGIYECQEIQHVLGNPGSAFQAGYIAFTHGETDSGNFLASYQSALTTLQANYQSDLQGVTSQSGIVPLIFSQQTSNPPALTGPDLVSIAMWLAAVANPTLILNAGPKYQFTYGDGGTGNGEHITQYNSLGDMYGKVAWQDWKWRTYGDGKPWDCLRPTNFSRNANVVTSTWNVPWGALVFDQSRPGPHLSGGLSMWALGRGLEAYDAAQTITAGTGNGVSPIVITMASTANYTTGQSVLVTGCLGNTSANGVATCTVQDATHLQLQGKTGNGTWSAGAGGAQVVNLIGITNTVISGSQITITLARSPTTGLTIGNADISDQPYGNFTGGFGTTSTGCCSLIRDSDPRLGRSSNFPLYNWSIRFRQAVA